MGYYSAGKRNKLVYTTIWMILQIIMLSEKKPNPKDYILYDSIHIITFLQ